MIRYDTDAHKCYHWFLGLSNTVTTGLVQKLKLSKQLLLPFQIVVILAVPSQTFLTLTKFLK
jgi:hypothetical protein